MATTINGFIAKENDDTSFVSENSWKEYLKMVEESDCIIVGRRTYEVMPLEEFVKGKLYVVFTTQTDLEEKTDKLRFTKDDPKLIIQSLKKEGVKQVCICGGGTLNSSFMTENLVDEIYLDVEPVIFGKGIRLFRENDFEAKLKLLEIKKLSDDEIQLHFQVLK
jgi:dihydrofolate reductase